MMARSPEIGALIMEWYRRIASGDMVRSAEAILSTKGSFVAIGTGPDEWVEDRDGLIRAYGEAARLGPPEIRVRRIEAYSEGKVGWAADTVILKRPSGRELPMRHTFVLHQENGQWKVVHAHYSFGVSDESAAAAGS